jgi:hypothetical protein
VFLRQNRLTIKKDWKLTGVSTRKAL